MQGHLLERSIDTGNVYIRVMNTKNVPPRYADWPVDPDTVGQYTGLGDIAGNPVFEGDVLMRNSEGSYDEFVVRFYAEVSKIIPLRSGWFVDTREGLTHPLSYVLAFRTAVMGNIHDSPPDWI